MLMEELKKLQPEAAIVDQEGAANIPDAAADGGHDSALFHSAADLVAASINGDGDFYKPAHISATSRRCASTDRPWA